MAKWPSDIPSIWIRECRTISLGKLFNVSHSILRSSKVFACVVHAGRVLPKATNSCGYLGITRATSSLLIGTPSAWKCSVVPISSVSYIG